MLLIDGLRVRTGDVNGLAEALTRLVADQGLRRRMGEAGRARLATEFDWQSKLRLVRDVCREVVENRSRQGGRRPRPACPGGAVVDDQIDNPPNTPPSAPSLPSPPDWQVGGALISPGSLRASAALPRALFLWSDFAKILVRLRALLSMLSISGRLYEMEIVPIALSNSRPDRNAKRPRPRGAFRRWDAKLPSTARTIYWIEFYSWGWVG